MKRIPAFFKHLMYMGLILIGLGVVFYFILGAYTRHNQEPIEVPNVQELNIDQATALLKSKGLDLKVIDTVYRDGVDLMTIVSQNPDPGMKVKKGRKIYLVINADDVPMIEMPDLAGKTSFDLAVKILKSKGLLLGEKIEQEDPTIVGEENQPVLEQRLSGSEQQIAPGTPVRMHSKIDLVVATPVRPADSVDMELETELE